MDALKTGAVVYNAGACSACGVCEIMCSLLHEGSASRLLSRANIIRNAFTALHSHVTCQQCTYPSCYYACPVQDQALCIDEATGTVYVNEDECIGCGSCVEACPFDPSRIKENTEKQVAFKCDLCREREEGPICVEYCPFQALTYVTKEERA